MSYSTYHNIAYTYRPKETIKVKTVAELEQLVKRLKKSGWKFRIMAGGHHHEAMCSGNDVTVIDVSLLKSHSPFLSKKEIKEFINREILNFSETDSAIWLGTGLTNSEIFPFFTGMNKLIPVGSCAEVGISGLTLGGGWNLMTRKYGLTCDALLAAKIILNDGIERIVSANHFPDLFKAIKGSGGGNFGIVTELLFKLIDTKNLWQFRGSIAFENANQLKKDLKDWISFQEKDDQVSLNLTSFVTLDPTLKLYFGGYCFAENEAEVKLQIGRISERYEKEAMDIVKVTKPNIALNASLDGLLEVSPFVFEGILNSAGNSVTPYKCSVPTAHKVTSAFAAGNCNLDALLNKIANHLKTAPEGHSAIKPFNLITFHALGGQVKRGKNSFGYRDKDFIIQVQSWWSGEKDAAVCENWVQTFRKAMYPDIEGAFINFPDSSIPLEEYYRKEFEDLKRVKAKYDREDFFHFPMSVPIE